MKNLLFTLLLCAFSHGAMFSQTDKDPTAAFQFSFLPPLSMNGIQSYRYTNDASFSLLAGVSKNEKAFAFAGISNIILKDGDGFLFAGLFNYAGRNGKGLSLSGLMNMTKKQYSGFQLGGIANIPSGKRTAIPDCNGGISAIRRGCSISFSFERLYE